MVRFGLRARGRLPKKLSSVTKVKVSKLFSLNFAPDWLANAYVGDGVFQEIKLSGWLADFLQETSNGQRRVLSGPTSFLEVPMRSVYSLLLYFFGGCGELERRARQTCSRINP
jgi:hypothetical protein